MCTEQGGKYWALINQLESYRRLRSGRGQRLRDLEKAAATGPLLPRPSNPRPSDPCPVDAPSPIAAPAHVASMIPTEQM